MTRDGTTTDFLPVPAPGTEHGGALADHEARSAARRVVFALTEAWDAGDEQAFGDCFTEHATISGLGGGPDAGAGAPSDRFGQHLAATSWSLHWLGNEQVSARDGHAGGSWLWWSFEELRDGRSAYAGGDLGVVLELTGRGYLIGDLEITERYRVPVTVGWLNDELPGPSAWPAALAIRQADGQTPRRIRPAATAPPGIGPSGPVPSGPVEPRLQVLAAERALRQLMTALVRGLEDQAPAGELAGLWSETGCYATVAGTATGRPQLAGQLAAEMAAERPVLRILGNGAVDATAGSATGRWRDLWVATDGGQARWQAHQYCAEAIRADGGGWKLRSLRRDRVLDAPYGSGWAVR